MWKSIHNKFNKIHKCIIQLTSLSLTNELTESHKIKTSKTVKTIHPCNQSSSPKKKNYQTIKEFETNTGDMIKNIHKINPPSKKTCGPHPQAQFH